MSSAAGRRGGRGRGGPASLRRCLSDPGRNKYTNSWSHRSKNFANQLPVCSPACEEPGSRRPIPTRPNNRRFLDASERPGQRANCWPKPWRDRQATAENHVARRRTAENRNARSSGLHRHRRGVPTPGGHGDKRDVTSLAPSRAGPARVSSTARCPGRLSRRTLETEPPPPPAGMGTGTPGTRPEALPPGTDTASAAPQLPGLSRARPSGRTAAPRPSLSSSATQLQATQPPCPTRPSG